MASEQQTTQVNDNPFVVYKIIDSDKKATSSASLTALGKYVAIGLLSIPALFGLLFVTSNAIAAPSNLFSSGNQSSPASRINTKILSKLGTVCIVGAGPSGLGTAVRLRSKGYTNVIVFEKSNVAGGKATNWVDPATQVPFFMGPVIGTTIAYTTVLSYLAEYSIPYGPVPTNPAYLYNAEVGVIVNPGANPSDPTPVIVAYQKYVALRAKFVAYLKPGYKKGIPDELAVPLFDWMAANDLLALQPAFWIGITTFGYGSLKEIPAFYALLYVEDSVLQYLIGQSPSFSTDFHALFTKVASTLPDVRYGVTITKTRRVSNGNNHGANKPVTLTYTDTLNVEKTQDCDSLVLAFPQRIDLLANFDLDKKETDVFSVVKTNQYSTSIVHMSGPSIGLHINFLQLDPSKSPPIFAGEPKGNGQPIIFTKQQLPLSDYVVAYSWKSDFLPGPEYSTNDFNGATTQVLSKVDRNENSPPSTNIPVTPGDIKATFKWDYFPHVSTADIKSGFYKKFEGLQGHLQTYFTSGLRGFETVEATLRSAHDLVDTYF